MSFFGDLVGGLGLDDLSKSEGNLLSTGILVTGQLLTGLLGQEARKEQEQGLLAQQELANQQQLAENAAERDLRLLLADKEAALRLQLAQIQAGAAGGRGPDRRTLAGQAMQQGAQTEQQAVANLIQGLQGSLRLGGTGGR